MQPRQPRPLRHRALAVLAVWCLVLLAGIVHPVRAAALQAEGRLHLDSLCLSVGSVAPVGADETPVLAPHHEALKCSLCWTAVAPPPLPALTGPRPLDRADRPLLAPARVLHRLAAGFEPARGPPRG